MTRRDMIEWVGWWGNVPSDKAKFGEVADRIATDGKLLAELAACDAVAAGAPGNGVAMFVPRQLWDRLQEARRP